MPPTFRQEKQPRGTLQTAEAVVRNTAAAARNMAAAVSVRLLIVRLLRLNVFVHTFFLLIAHNFIPSSVMLYITTKLVVYIFRILPKW